MGHAFVRGQARLDRLGQQNVFDVYTKSDGIALDGTN